MTVDIFFITCINADASDIALETATHILFFIVRLAQMGQPYFVGLQVELSSRTVSLYVCKTSVERFKLDLPLLSCISYIVFISCMSSVPGLSPVKKNCFCHKFHLPCMVPDVIIYFVYLASKDSLFDKNTCRAENTQSRFTKTWRPSNNSKG